MKDKKLLEMINSADYEMNVLACTILMGYPFSQIRRFFHKFGAHERDIYRFHPPRNRGTLLPYRNSMFLAEDFFLNIMQGDVVLVEREPNIPGLRVWMENDRDNNICWIYDKRKGDK
jgi:hypothetical protein